MATLSERIWERHSHPWSAWLEVLIYPLVYLPAWNRSWQQGLAVAALFAVDITAFPPAKNKRAWITRAMLGEQIWMQEQPRDASIAIVTLQTAAALGAFTMAYKRRLGLTISLASIALLFKLWFLQRMVMAYDHQSPDK